MKDKEYETQLRDNYGNIYQTKRNEDRIYALKCNSGYGEVQPNDFRGEFGLFVSGDEHFNSSKKKTTFLNKLPKYCEVTQEGDWDFVVKFPLNKLPMVEKLFRLRKRVNRSKDSYLTSHFNR